LFIYELINHWIKKGDEAAQKGQERIQILDGEAPAGMSSWRGSTSNQPELRGLSSSSRINDLVFYFILLDLWF